MNNRRPSILLGMPNVHGIYRSVADNLRYCGFDVLNLTELDNAFQYPSLFSRLGTKFRQHVLKDADAKRLVKAGSLKNTLDAKFDEFGGGVDYALFISGDVYHPRLLSFIRDYVRLDMVNYQWDGMRRFPAIWQCVREFDRFYVFDLEDLNHTGYRFLPATNFYFDTETAAAPEETAAQAPKPEKQPENGSGAIYFTGTHQPGRAALLNRFAEYAAKAGWPLDFSLVWAVNRNMKEARQTYPGTNIRLSHTGGSFQDNLAHARRSSVLADFLETGAHRGLSFRTFEALGYGKKLITTNPDAARYDFYRPENTYILTENNFDGIQAFLDTPYQAVPAGVREKYSSGNWIRYLLQMTPHQPITLPSP